MCDLSVFQMWPEDTRLELYRGLLSYYYAEPPFVGQLAILQCWYADLVPENFDVLILVMETAV